MGIQNILKTVQLEPRTKQHHGRSSYKKPIPGHEIVITGMAGKFPDSDDIYHFRDNLFNKVDLVSGDERRWKHLHPEVPQRTGKLNDIERFDLGFFGLSKLQTDNMDPMARILLEKVFEAMVDAGYHPSDFENTNTGVFVGCCFSETEKFAFYNYQVCNGDAVLGSQRSMIAKRINYFYKLNGPSFITDTACSSSLFALEHAYRHLKEGLCDKAIVCGTNLCLHPIVSLQFSRLGVLSPDGCCKSFDDSGNGYARSEAVGALLLERSKDAKRVYAEVLHTKTNCDGYKEQGITFPSSGMQKVLMKEFYEEVKIDPTTLTYVEAHGTGTQVGDPEELDTLDEIFCTGRTKTLHIGTIKSNIGHNEPVSALCSIVKVLIGTESGFIPPNLHFKVPRKGVEGLESGRMTVVTEKMPWPDNKGLIGVNSFGFGGGNGHVLLKWNTKVKTNNGEPRDNLPRLVCISGRTQDGVETVINDATSRKLDAEFINLIHQVYRKRIPNQMFRGYTIITKENEIARDLIKLSPVQSKLCLVFTNIDEAWFQLRIEDLMTIPIFAGSIQRIHDVLNKKLSLNITTILMSSKQENYINQVLGAVSIQLAIANILKELNLKVDLMIGIGFGELLCGYLDDFLSMEEVILSAYYIASALDKTSAGSNKSKLKEVLPRKAHKPTRWVPIYKKNPPNACHPLGSIEYLVNNILRPISLDDCQKYTNPEDVLLIIGNGHDDNKENRVQLLELNQKDAIVNLLNSLGKVYLKGVDMELDKLYPEISYPVSRGTPMLSPLIKWDHSRNCLVHVYRDDEERKSGQRFVHVNTKLDDWGFVAGHVVDGRNLFPATGYLALIWESYAIIVGKLMSQMRVVFENVKFSRAANIPNDGVLTLRVIVQLGVEYFEVLEEDTVLVSGTVYEAPQNNRFANLPSPAVDPDEGILDKKDVYKELKLRGYHYKDQFRAIEKCNLEGTNAIISWTGNWITFMDNMLQVQILQEDTRNLYVPTSIQRLVIDGPRHIEYVRKYQNEIPVVCHKSLNLTRGGGIEIRGLGASGIPRKKTGEPVLEVHKFIPYEAQLGEEDAIRCFVQTILENANVIKVKAIEMGTEKLFIPLVQRALADLPLIQAELMVLSKKQFDIPGVQVEDRLLSMESGCLLVIATDILNNHAVLETALKATREPSGYIISHQSSSMVPPTNIKILSSYVIQSGTLVLLQEAKQSVDRTPMEISCSLEDLSWIQPLQDLVKTNQKIVLHCRNSEPEGLLGFVNCLRREQNGSNISAVILMDEAPPFDINREFYKTQLDKNLAINIWKGGRWGSYRHLLMPSVQLVESEHCFVNVLTRGDLSSLKWIEGPLNKTARVEQDSDLVAVYYSAINFRDVMTASGRIQADVITRDRILQECVQGFEFSGRDSSGRRVMGMITSGAMSTMIVADKHLLISVPPQWSLEDAATVPVVYGTVIYSLFMRGHMRRGQSILIHSGTGGVGQAAINIAIHHGCVIFTTVGTPEKKAFIKKHFPQIKEEHIGDSRSTSFEQMVLKYTNGRGVDFVLNSLAEEKLQASVRCLAVKGTFLEIGKFDLASDNHIAVKLLKKQANFLGITLDHIFNGSRRMKGTLLAAFNEVLKSGAIKPLIRTTFEMDEIETAFRYMATGKHMGKVLIKVRDEENTTGPLVVPRTLFKAIPRFYCNPSSTYVILGGLGGFGLELADWLVVRGAKKLILTSRSGIKNGYQLFRLKTFENYAATVIIKNDDAATEKGCEDLLKAAEALGPVDGIFNLAVVLQDALFENQTEEAFGISLAPKAIATKHLDAISRVLCPKLRHFVVFSSVSCGRGNAGQTNYGMANSVMERVCELRKRDGYPALAVQWGAVGEVGLVAEMQENHKELVIGGTLQQKISSCLQTLANFLRQDETIVASMVVAEKKSGAGANNIFDAVLNIIGVTNLKAVSIHATFPELGMDSMMGVEIKQTLEREYEVFLTAQDIRSMTLAKLKDMANETGEATPIKQQIGEMNNLPEDIALLVRHIAGEESANTPIIYLKTAIGDKAKAPIVFGLAGIEGMATIYQPIAEHMRFHFTCLQFCAGQQADSIEELAKPLVKIIESTPGKFSIIAYSFGCVVAIELMYILERSGKTGKALFIDGAPELMAKLANLHFSEDNEEIFQTSLLCILMTKYMPFDEIVKHKYDIMKHRTYEEKIRYVMKISPKVDLNEDYIIEVCKATLNRLKAVKKYQPKFEDRLSSAITLVKPSKQSVVEIEHDYNLSGFCKEEVRIHILEGNHVTILENTDLRNIIEEFMDGTPGKAPLVTLSDGNTIGIEANH